MKCIKSPLFLFAFLQKAFADMRFTSPSRGQVILGAQPLMVAWEETGQNPTIDQLQSYDMFLCTRGDDSKDVIELENLIWNASFTMSNQVNVIIKYQVLELNDKRLFFLKMLSTLRDGGTVSNYSPRFILTLVSPSSPIPSFSSDPNLDLDGPPRELNLTKSYKALELRKRIGVDSFTVSLSLQFGPTIYAPMQSYPPTKITKASPTPQYPQSSYSIAITPLPPNKSIQTTITQGITWSFSQRENPNPGLPKID